MAMRAKNAYLDTTKATRSALFQLAIWSVKSTPAVDFYYRWRGFCPVAAGINAAFLALSPRISADKCWAWSRKQIISKCGTPAGGVVLALGL